MQTIKMAFETPDGTATSKKTKNEGRDYASTSGSLSIRAGMISGTITVPITNDGIAEGDEYFSVLLSKPSNATIGINKAQVTIKDGIPPALTKVLPRTTEQNMDASGDFSVQVQSNPSTGHFTLQLKSSSAKPVNYKVVDAIGRLVENRNSVPINSNITMGAQYRLGIYYVQLMQDQKMITVKLVKRGL